MIPAVALSSLSALALVVIRNNRNRAKKAGEIILVTIATRQLCGIVYCHYTQKKPL
jgi:hypothetical protein